MAFPTSLQGLGMPGGLAIEVCGRVQTGLTATGAAQGDALQTPAIINVFSTVAASTGARLPPAEVGAGMSVANLGANALLLYPSTGQTINGAAANTPVSIPVGKVAQLTGVTGTAWIAQIGA